jgi:hypothetical protein
VHPGQKLTGPEEEEDEEEDNIYIYIYIIIFISQFYNFILCCVLYLLYITIF